MIPFSTTNNTPSTIAMSFGRLNDALIPTPSTSPADPDPARVITFLVLTSISLIK